MLVEKSKKKIKQLAKQPPSKRKWSPGAFAGKFMENNNKKKKGKTTWMPKALQDNKLTNRATKTSREGLCVGVPAATGVNKHPLLVWGTTNDLSTLNI